MGKIGRILTEKVNLKQILKKSEKIKKNT